MRINLLCIAAKKFVFGKHYRERFKPSLKLVIEFQGHQQVATGDLP